MRGMWTAANIMLADEVGHPECFFHLYELHLSQFKWNLFIALMPCSIALLRLRPFLTQSQHKSAPPGPNIIANMNNDAGTISLWHGCIANHIGNCAHITRSAQ